MLQKLIVIVAALIVAAIIGWLWATAGGSIG